VSGFHARETDAARGRVERGRDRRATPRHPRRARGTLQARSAWRARRRRQIGRGHPPARLPRRL